jgi:hypothetical protein
LKWDKNKGTKGYLRVVVDDVGVVGVRRRDVRHWFVRVFVQVPIDGGLDGGGGRCAGGYIGNGHLILLHRRGFFFGILSTRSGEDDGTGEAVAVRIREWASVERERKRGSIKMKVAFGVPQHVSAMHGCSVHRDTRLTLRRLVYSVLPSGLIQIFYMYSVFPSST